MKTPKPRRPLAMIQFIVLEHPALSKIKGHEQQCPAARITLQSGVFFTVAVQ